MTHAWLFTGFGRERAALLFAASLLCRSGGCGTCSDCVTTLAGSHGDLELVKTDGLSIKIDDVRDGDVKQNKDFIYRQYSESVPTLTKSPEPKVSRFSLDKDLINKKKRGDTSLSSPKASQGDGVGPTTNIRRGGGADSAGAGLGNQTYSESRGGTQEFSNDDVANFSAQTKGPTPNPLGEKKTLKKFKESIFDFGSGDSGVGGTLGGASNKEPTVMPIDKYGQSGITIKKKKSGAK